MLFSRLVQLPKRETMLRCDGELHTADAVSIWVPWVLIATNQLRIAKVLHIEDYTQSSV